MNILLLPSWYPSKDFPIQGIFIKEQVWALTELFPDLNIGISLWGQNEQDTLLWAKDHFKNISKISHFRKSKKVESVKLKDNLIEFHNPVLTWTKQVWKGNFNAVLKANEKNLQNFQDKFGKVDMIHAQICHQAGLIAYHLSEKYNIPYVITEQMSPFPFPSILTKKEKIKSNYLKAYQNAQFNIAISPPLQEKMQKQDIPNTIFIPNLTDEDFFVPKEKMKNKDKFHFFTLARMEEQKDIPTLLEAIKKVIQENTHLHFYLAGNGSKLEEYKNLARILKIENFVTWLGLLNREEARYYFQESNAFVLASQHETLGVVFIEAIACGKPIIATRCGGPECIVNQNNGFLLEVGDVTVLAEKILFMSDSNTKWDRNIIREDFLDRFSKKAVCKQLMELYQKVIKNIHYSKS